MTAVDDKRKSGIDIIGEVPWGTHFCQFYQTGEDLLDILVPYFKAGLENNEFCMWVTSKPVEVVEAHRAIQKAIPNVDRYLENGQLEIIPYDQWYTQSGYFDQERVLQGWVDKLNAALTRGFDGLRLTGNTFWLEKADWRSFADYEAAVDKVLGHYRMVALCTYSLNRCGASEIADVVSNHEFALIKRQGRWEIIESAARRRSFEALRLSETKYQSLFENMPAGFAYHEIVIDEQGRPIDYVFLEVNDAFQRLTGLLREDILGKRVTAVIPGIEKSAFDWIGAYARVALEGESIRFEQYSEALGRWYSVSSYSPARGYFVAVFVDITERKRVEDTLRGARDELEARVQARTAELARANEELLAEIAQRKRAEEETRILNDELECRVIERTAQLEAAAKELEAFSYSVSHDLRAPLRGIDGFSQALLEDYGNKLDDTGKDYLRRVRAASQNMAQLIDDLLKLSRLTRREMQRGAVNLSALAHSVAAELQEMQPDRRVEFVIADGVVANGDARLLGIVLENLLGNAWKFSAKHASARIEFGVSELEGSSVYFIRDDGAGFDPAYAHKLFHPFHRLHGTTEFPGTGIGLATVQRIVRRHGGRVWAEGAVEKGATFYFTL